MVPYRLTLAVDAMGGDDAPAMVIEGVDISSRKLSGVQYLLFGNEAEILPLLEEADMTALVEPLGFVQSSLSCGTATPVRPLGTGAAGFLQGPVLKLTISNSFWPSTTVAPSDGASGVGCR